MVTSQVAAQAAPKIGEQVATQVAPKVGEQIATQAAPQVAPHAGAQAGAHAAPHVSLNFIQSLASTTAGIGVLGGIIGVSSSVARNMKGHREGLVDTKEVVYDAGKEGVGAGAATVLGAMAVGAVGGGLALSLGTAVVVASASKYVWDRSIEQLELSLHDNAEADETAKEAVVEETVEVEDPLDFPANHRRGYEL
ncbi:MAG: magnetosome protein MamC [Gammaproteobacteria bacterium]|jgi:hypothetical protein|nr:magnetosome protein MamC [Gammaproteobacteria bacterium]MBT7307635.1 magnetosome protein MamC [Gammaproteobacteria bacterium]